MMHRAGLVGVTIAAALLGTSSPALAGGACKADVQETPQNILALDYFATGFGFDGDLVVIGASQRNHGPGGAVNDAGSAFIYAKVAGVWAEWVELEPVNPIINASMGDSVDTYGDWVVAAAPGYSANQVDTTGAVYVFKFDRDSNTWQQFDILIPADAADGDSFGGEVAKSHQGVAMHGDTIVVGAPFADSYDAQKGYNVKDAGKVYIFVYDAVAGEWTEAQTLTAPTMYPEENFGFSVAFDGVNILIGAPTGSQLAGAAYFYKYDPVSAQWVYDEMVQADVPAFGDDFGFSVALDGRDAVVGDPNSTGAAYVFRWGSASGWGPSDAKLVPSQGGPEFGWCTAIDDNLIVVGCRAHDNPDVPNTNSGAAYVFQRDILGTDPWPEVMFLLPADAFASGNDRFGDAVGVYGNDVFIGATGDEIHNSGYQQHGILYLYEDAPLCEYD